MSDRISAEFPFESKFVEVKGSQMHYIEEGEGDPIVFLHGNPTSNYLWRNVIPHLTGKGRCIAPDLIGMGKSDKPDIPYRVFDHAEYFTGFMEALGLKNVTLVLHDWGGFMGCDYAAKHLDNVRAVVLMETVFKPMSWAGRSEQTQGLFRMLRSEKGREKVLEENFFVEKILPGSIIRKLTDEEMAVYRAPFEEKSSRLLTWVFPNEIPYDGEPADVTEAADTFSKALAGAGLPMLLLTFTPGVVVGAEDEAWARENFTNLTVKPMGSGIHFVQEDQPDAIGQAISKWMADLA